MKEITLPNELWLSIDNYNILTHKDYYPLVLVNQRFNRMFTRFLYADLHLHFQGPFWSPPTSTNPSKYARFGLSIGLLLETIETTPEFQSYVRSCCLIGLRFENIIEDLFLFFDRDEKLAEFARLCRLTFTLLGRLPNLRSISLIDCRLYREAIHYLATLPSLKYMELDRVEPTGFHEGLQPNAYTLTTFIVHRSRFEGSLLNPGLSGYIRHLDIGESRLDALHEAHLQAGGEPLLRLESITIDCIVFSGLPFFYHTPNVTAIRVRRSEEEKADNTLDKLAFKTMWSSALQKLRCLKMPSDGLDLFMRGRSIRYVYTWSTLDIGGLAFPLRSSMLPRLSVETVCWTQCFNGPTILAQIVKSNPTVQHLYIKSVGSSALLRWLVLCRKLIKLRSLALRFWQLLSVGWERDQWDSLLNYCPDLNWISVNTGVVWIRHPHEKTWRRQEVREKDILLHHPWI